MNKNQPCDFCDEFSGGSSNAFSAWYSKDLRDRTLLETKHIRVLPTLGQFVKGYLLIVPTIHYCRLADMPSEALLEVEYVKTLLVGRLQSLYGNYTFFEHGGRTSDSGGCGIYHAHLHALPLEADITLPKLKEQFPHKSLGSLLELKSVESVASYLYYEDTSAHSWLFFPKFLPSQYMRRLMAEAAGISRWDWRCSGREDAFLATRSEVASVLTGCA